MLFFSVQIAIISFPDFKFLSPLAFSLITTLYLTKTEIKIEISLAQPSQQLRKKYCVILQKIIQQNLRTIYGKILAP